MFVFDGSSHVGGVCVESAVSRVVLTSLPSPSPCSSRAGSTASTTSRCCSPPAATSAVSEYGVTQACEHVRQRLLARAAAPTRAELSQHMLREGRRAAGAGIERVLWITVISLNSGHSLQYYFTICPLMFLCFTIEGKAGVTDSGVITENARVGI